eukprot:CFRG2202T1
MGNYWSGPVDDVTDTTTSTQKQPKASTPTIDPIAIISPPAETRKQFVPPPQIDSVLVKKETPKLSIHTPTFISFDPNTAVLQSTEFVALATTSAVAMGISLVIATIQTRRLRTVQRSLSQKYSVKMAQIESRLRRDALEAKDAGVRALSVDILGVADNLDRAITAADKTSEQTKSSEHKALLDGIVMTQDGLTAVLRKHNVERMDSIHAPFDPNLHEAVYQYTDDKAEVGSVGTVVLEGYTWKNRILRAAKVGVVSSPATSE